MNDELNKLIDLIKARDDIACKLSALHSEICSLTVELKAKNRAIVENACALGGDSVEEYINSDGMRAF
uniref:Uncharacterized protein eiDWFOrf7 n=1 Tax=Edwardsiella phage eiDWF TaxID=945084 RepID=E7EKV0_9VIRU|nr:unknown [Edwardsiella phage eiDWF]